MAGLATMHLSPLLVLAAVSDLAYGSQAYLRELAEELKRQGVIDPHSSIQHVDDLLSAVGETSRVTASAFDTPPLSVEGLRDTIEQTRAALRSVDPSKVIPQAEIARLWDEMQQVARQEGVSPWAVSTAMTLFTLSKVSTVGRGALSGARVAGNLFDRHVLDHYRESLSDIRRRGLYGVLRDSSGPYIEAVWQNFSSDKPTITEDLLSGKLLGKARGACDDGWGTPATRRPMWEAQWGKMGYNRVAAVHRRRDDSIALPSIGERGMSTVKETMTHIIDQQPDDSSYDEILRELAFGRMVDRGLADSDQGRIIENSELERRIQSWRK